jgi:hypothetical protein
MREQKRPAEKKEASEKGTPAKKKAKVTSDGGAGARGGLPAKARAAAAAKAVTTPVKAAKKKAESSGGDGKAAKTPKKVKDKNAPKGARSAFMCFSQEQRASVMSAQPELKMGGVAKVLGARYAYKSRVRGFVSA